jgi:hypothetical protein
MTKNCGYCGRAFESARPAGRYCSDRCRMRAHRHPEVIGLRRKPEPPTGELLTIVRKQLHDLGETDSYAGWAAEQVAAAMCSPGTLPSAVASLSRSLEESLAYLREPGRRPPDADEVAAVRALRDRGKR